MPRSIWQWVPVRLRRIAPRVVPTRKGRRQNISSVANSRANRSASATNQRLVVDPAHLPIPWVEMRELVGPTDPKEFDNPTRSLIYHYLPYVTEDRYECFFDFGCGCGRVARQLIQQRVPPKRYVGVDLHKGMVDGHKGISHRQPTALSFITMTSTTSGSIPRGRSPRWKAFQLETAEFTMVHALSVFTHLTQMQTEFYLSEVARILRDDGVFVSSWLLFDKALFPFLPDNCWALYASDVDPSAAVVYDREWVQSLATRCGMVIAHIRPPPVRGHQWMLTMKAITSGAPKAEWPLDEAPIGKRIAPPGRSDPHLIH